MGGFKRSSKIIAKGSINIGIRKKLKMISDNLISKEISRDRVSNKILLQTELIWTILFLYSLEEQNKEKSKKYRKKRL